MKRIFLFSVCMLMAFLSQAQTASGDKPAGAKDVVLTLTNENLESTSTLEDAYNEALKNVTGDIALTVVRKDGVTDGISAECFSWLIERVKANGNIIYFDATASGLKDNFTGNFSGSKLKTIKLPQIESFNLNENLFQDMGDLEYLQIGTWNNWTAATSDSYCEVNNIGHNAFRNCPKLKNLHFEVSGTIGNDVFRKSGITDCPVKPAQGKTITLGSFVFGECEGLVTVTIPENIDKIGENVFNGCKNLTTVTLSSTVEKVEYNSIENCTAFTGFKVVDSETSKLMAQDGILYTKDGTTLVLCQMYKEISSTSSISFPTGLTAIGEKAFSKCSQLAEVDFSGCTALTTVGTDAFRGSSITKLILPETVTGINSNSFIYDCEKLTAIEVKGNGVFVSKDGVMYKKEDVTDGKQDYTLFACPAQLSSVTENTVKVFPTITYSKEENGSIIPQSTEELKFQTLNLFDIEKDLNGKLTKVEEGAFYKNQNIITLVLPDNVNNISDQSFQDCKMKYLAVPYSLKGYGVTIMVGCHDFEAYFVYDNKNDGRNQKIKSEKIGSITYYTLENFSVGSRGVLYGRQYQKMYSVPAQYVPDNDDHMFKTYDNIRRIHPSCFRNTKNIKTVFLSQGIMDVPHQCFMNSDMEKIIIPNSVVRLGQDMFRSCKKLKDVYWLTTSTHVPENQNGNYNIFYGYDPPAGAKFHFSVGYDGLVDAYTNAKDTDNNGFHSLSQKPNMTFTDDINHRALFEEDNGISGFNDKNEITNENYKKFDEAPGKYDISWIRDADKKWNINTLSAEKQYEYITLYRDFYSTKSEEYNTLALPFSLTRKQMREKFEMRDKPDDHAEVYEFTGRINNTITFKKIDLENGDDDDIVLKKGVAVLIKPIRKRHSYLFEFEKNATAGTVFANVTAGTKTSEGTIESVTTTGNKGYYINGEKSETPRDFTHAFYATYQANATVGSHFYYVTADGQVKFATNERTITKAFRGYILGSEAAEKTTQLAPAMMTIDIDGVITGLDDIKIDGERLSSNVDGNIYSIDGRLVRTGSTSLSGLPKGLYIVNGKKVVIK